MQTRTKQQIISYLSSIDLGLKRKSVTIKAYNPQWVEAFDLIKKQIELCLTDKLSCRIEHIGSTSVPGLAAKPILDILLIFDNQTSLTQAIPLLERFGFTYKGDAISRVTQSSADPDRHFFSFYNKDAQDEDASDFIHAHMFCRDHVYIKPLLYFRDQLRSDSSLRDEYQNIKMQLWQGGKERSDYTLSKEKFVGKILAKLNIASHSKSDKNVIE